MGLLGLLGALVGEPNRPVDGESTHVQIEGIGAEQARAVARSLAERAEAAFGPTASDDPVGLADSPNEVLVSMGNYVFDADALVAAVEADGESASSGHDMGGDIVPYFVERGEAGYYDMKQNDVPGSSPRDRSYWRDVGTIDSYFDAHMDLISTLPIFNLYNTAWPIRTQTVNTPPAKFVRDAVGRIGNTIDSIVSAGSVLSGTHLERSVVGVGSLASGGSTITDSVLLDGVLVGAGARVHRAVLDKNVVLEDGATVGVDRERDLGRGFTITGSGITVVGKGIRIAR